jgi:hypothetical protein
VRTREDVDDIGVNQPKDHRVRRRDQEERAFATSWDPDGTTGLLRDVGLLELSEIEAQCCMKNPQDDQVAQEIRVLQSELRATILHTNAAKRALRQMFDRCVELFSWLREVSDRLVSNRALHALSFTGASRGCPSRNPSTKPTSPNTTRSYGGKRCESTAEVLGY